MPRLNAYSLLVDVAELRKRGMERLREDVLAAVSLRGLLSLSPGRLGWHSDSLPHFAVPPTSRHLLACHRVHVEVKWT